MKKSVDKKSRENTLKNGFKQLLQPFLTEFNDFKPVFNNIKQRPYIRFHRVMRLLHYIYKYIVVLRSLILNVFNDIRDGRFKG